MAQLQFHFISSIHWFSSLTTTIWSFTMFCLLFHYTPFHSLNTIRTSACITTNVSTGYMYALPFCKGIIGSLELNRRLISLRSQSSTCVTRLYSIVFVSITKFASPSLYIHIYITVPVLISFRGASPLPSCALPSFSPSEFTAQ